MGQGDVAVERLRATHDFNGASVKLGGDTRFAFVFAPRDHADTRNENDGRIRVAHRGRVRPFAPVIVIRVILAILLKAGLQFGFDRLETDVERSVIRSRFGKNGRLKRNVKRFDFGAQEMVGATRAEFGETRGILGIDETEHFFVVLDGGNEALFGADLSAQPRQNAGEDFAAQFFGQSRMQLAAEGCRDAAFFAHISYR